MVLLKLITFPGTMQIECSAFLHQVGVESSAMSYFLLMEEVCQWYTVSQFGDLMERRFGSHQELYPWMIINLKIPCKWRRQWHSEEHVLDLALACICTMKMSHSKKVTKFGKPSMFHITLQTVSSAIRIHECYLCRVYV